MANNRAAIRSALKALLVDEDTSAGSNVYSNRETALWKSELPAILIYTSQENATPESFSGRRSIRDLEITIHLKIEATEDIDDDLDAFAGEVEDAIDSDSTVGGTVSGIILKTTEIRIDAEGDKDIGVAVLTYECKYVS